MADDTVRSVRPGDVFRIDGRFLGQRIDEDHIDYLTVHYDTYSPGLAHVVDILDDGMIVDLWGHRFHTSVCADEIRPLGFLARLLAPERLGEALLRREVEAGTVLISTGRISFSRQPLVRLWVRATYGRLPVLEALGGRIRLPVIRRIKSRLRYWFGRMGIMPRAPGFLDHGMLIDCIGMTVEFDYSGKHRRFWLDRILLHKNHSIHLVGIDLDADEQRTFRLDRIFSLSITGLGDVAGYRLYGELETLLLRREGWLRYEGRVAGRALSRMRTRVLAIWKEASNLLAALRTMRLRAIGREARVQVTAITPETGKPRQTLRPPARTHIRQTTGPADMPAWRRRLLRAIEAASSGEYEQVTCLLPMNIVLKTQPSRCRPFLQHLMALTLEEAKADPSGHPMTVSILTEALAISPDLSMPISQSKRFEAGMLLTRIGNLLPGSKRIWVHAWRRSTTDARLLLCESYLTSVYHVGYSNDPIHESPLADPPRQWGFYRTGCYFIAHWDDLRFRVDSSSVPKLMAILAWWDAQNGEGFQQ